MATACAQVLPVEAAACLDSFSKARQEFNDLVGWLQSDAVGLPLQEVENGVGERSREVLRLLLQGNLDARGRGDVGPAVEVRDGDRVVVLSHKDPDRNRDIRTVFGKVEVPRTAYGRPGERSVCPIDDQVQLPERSFSYVVQHHLVLEAVKGPYKEAVATMATFTGLAVQKKTCEDVVRDAAVDFEDFYAQRTVPPPSETGSIVVGSIDCKGIPIIQETPPPHSPPGAPVERRRGVKQMATVAEVHTVQPRPRTPESVTDSLFKAPAKLSAVGSDKDQSPEARAEHKRVWASLDKTKEDVAAEVAQEVERRDPDRSKTRVALTDGERALQKLVLKLMPSLLLILDFLHVLDKLWKAANVLCGESKKYEGARLAWVRRQALRILQGQVSEVVRGIRQSVTKRKINGKDRKILLNVAGYLYRNRQHMRYDEYLAQGLPIASGAVEGACKNLVKDRMERSGMRWGLSADPMLKMRAVYLSGDFEGYWRYHVEAEQRRRRGDRTWRPLIVVGKK